MNLITVEIKKPEEINFILGQSHFIKTVEDIHESSRQCRAGNQVWTGVLRGFRKMSDTLVGDGRSHDRVGPE